MKRLAAILLPIACALGIFVLGSLPAGASAPRVNDKVAHFLVFACLAACAWPASAILADVVAAKRASRRSNAPLFVVLVLATAYATGIGALLEILQSTLPHRRAEWGDLLADALGALFGGWVALRVAKWQRRFGTTDG